MIIYIQFFQQLQYQKSTEKDLVIFFIYLTAVKGLIIFLIHSYKSDKIGMFSYHYQKNH